MNDGLTHRLQLAGAVLEARARESLDTAQFLQGLPHSHGPHPDSTEFAQHEYALLALPPVSLHSPCLLSTCLLSPCLTGAQRGVPLTGALAGAECSAFEGSLRGVERGDGCSTFAGSRRGVRCCTLAARCSPALPNRPLLSEPRLQGCFRSMAQTLPSNHLAQCERSFVGWCTRHAAGALHLRGRIQILVGTQPSLPSPHAPLSLSPQNHPKNTQLEKPLTPTQHRVGSTPARV